MGISGEDSRENFERITENKKGGRQLREGRNLLWKNKSDGAEKENSWRRGLTPQEAYLHSERERLLSILLVRGLGG